MNAGLFPATYLAIALSEPEFASKAYAITPPEISVIYAYLADASNAIDCGPELPEVKIGLPGIDVKMPEDLLIE
jgi:hypothetical protein